MSYPTAAAKAPARIIASVEMFSVPGPLRDRLAEGAEGEQGREPRALE